MTALVAFTWESGVVQDDLLMSGVVVVQSSPSLNRQQTPPTALTLPGASVATCYLSQDTGAGGERGRAAASALAITTSARLSRPESPVMPEGRRSEESAA